MCKCTNQTAVDICEIVIRCTGRISFQSPNSPVLVTLLRFIVTASVASFRACHSLPLEQNNNKLSFGFTASVVGQQSFQKQCISTFYRVLTVWCFLSDWTNVDNITHCRSILWEIKNIHCTSTNTCKCILVWNALKFNETKIIKSNAQ